MKLKFLLIVVMGTLVCMWMIDGLIIQVSRESNLAWAGNNLGPERKATPHSRVHPAHPAHPNQPNQPNPTPVPEPSTLILLGMGAIGIGFYLYKQQRK